MKPEDITVMISYCDPDTGDEYTYEMSPLDYTDRDSFLMACNKAMPQKAQGEYWYWGHIGFPEDLMSRGDVPGSLWDMYTYYLESGDEWEAILAYVDEMQYWDEIHFEESYCGKYESEREYAEEYAQSCIPDNGQYVAGYFDYDAFAQDLFRHEYTFLNGYVFEF